MKKIRLVTLCLVASTSHAERLHASIGPLVPKNWQIIAFAQGDLNQDNVADLAVLLKPPKTDISGPTLFIYFNQNHKYRLKSSKAFGAWVYANEKDCIGSAFDESSLIIQRHTLNIKFNDEPICSNTYGINYSYKFKYAQNQFQLIGFDSFSGDKLSGNITEKSVNY